MTERGDLEDLNGEIAFLYMYAVFVPRASAGEAEGVARELHP